jgi:translation initiation factor 2 beta subunit (eIF-2beta)/eIF-5
MKLNINPNSDDPNYRYQMDSVVILKTGQGKNSHTVITNINNIADMINIDSVILLNYMGYVLGTSVNMEIMGIKGHYENDIIQNIIYQFIIFITLCNKCNIPELTPTVTKTNKEFNLFMKCSACGHNYELVGNNKINQKIIDFICKYCKSKKVT